MTITIELTDEEIKDAVLQIVAKRVASDMDAEYGSSVKYVTRKEVKAVIRELLKERMDEYADLAVKAASKSIENKAVKKLINQLNEDEDNLVRQAEAFLEYAKQKRKWENAFQRWIDVHGIENLEHTEKSYGCCGYGSMCDWCKDDGYGRPCVRALNAMCREKRITIDYTDYDFTKIW